ncbi:kinesin-like protein KIF21A isoform X1 [Watersipora subatra]|uniref:kinesin-like protein KIF21A isoform X1 n=2 Tax=Watersipora subatra TaxID=2589382 RepID=UPI00355B7E46
MIEELERSQRQLQTIRQHYEDEMLNLQDQIMAVERERDQVLSSLGSKKQQSEERVRKVKMDFEKRLDTMQQELNKVNTAKKEHAKMMKNQVVYDRRIRDLSTELNEMKKIKVRLMAQMKTESEKNKISDQRKNKELLQLEKETRQRDNQVRTLELQNRQEDAILKRKHEEVSQLRKRQRDSSASSRVMAKNRANLSHKNSSGKTSSCSASRHKSAALLFSPKVAKSKWDKLERYVTSVVVRKQTIANMEAEMDLHISKREQLSKKIDAYSKRLDTAIRRNETTVAMDREDQLETMSTNMTYIQSNVSECQNNIMQMEEEAKDETSLTKALDVSSVDESKYLLEHLLSLALTQGFACTQKESQFKELTARYDKMQMDSRLRDQLLDQVLQDSGITIQSQQESEINHS